MTLVDELSHPAVALPLPLDGATHELEIPTGTTLFFWTTLAIGTPDRLPPTQSSIGRTLFSKGVKAREQMSWCVSIDGESVPLLDDSLYREYGYTGLAWWGACEPVQLPASVRIRFEAGEAPLTHRGTQCVLWTKQGRKIPWESASESTLKLTPSPVSPSEFPTHQEQLWERHTVYTPQ